MRRTVPRERLELGAVDAGLSSREAAQRLVKFGENTLADVAENRAFRLLLDTLRDPMLWFLLIAAVLFAITGEWRESIVLLVALVPLTGMDAYLHWRTASSTKSLQRRLATTASILRDGKECAIPVKNIVPGDILIARAGESISADGLVIAIREVQVDESPLTGESLPVIKSALLRMPRGAAPQVDGEFWGFAGTKVLTGEVKLAVAYTGSQTLYGEIIQSVASSRHEKTPLQLAVARLVQRLIYVAIGFCIILACARLLQGKGLVDAVVSAATLALAAIPEEFPVVFTFFLGVGVFRMARRKALVRRAVSVENIGRVTCICSDKTGTLTEGRLKLAHVLGRASVSEIEVQRIAALASRPDSLDPIDQTILEGFSNGELPSPLAVFPFTEARRREVAAIRKSNMVQIVAKGAPETIFTLCDLTAAELDKYSEIVQSFARQGHKMLACATQDLPFESWQSDEPTSGYQLVGLLAFEDPARSNVPAAIKDCQRAGIHVVMITGDHPATAEAIAREIGLGGSSPRVYSAEEPDFASKSGDFFRAIDVVARAMPSQKLAIVQALRARGEIVAVTGDGINDVPALQMADVGIAMGGRGTRSAREVAAIVLVDDNFASVVSAIAEGRQLFANLRRSFQYLIIVHLPLVVTAAFLPLVGVPLLYLPIHVVWLELVIHPTAMLAFQEPANSSIAGAQPTLSSTLLSRREWVYCCVAGVSLAVAVGWLFLLGNTSGWSIERSRTLAIVTLVLGGAVAAAVVGKLRTRASRMILVITVFSAFAFTEIFAISQLLHLVVLTPSDWLMVLMIVLVVSGLPKVLDVILERQNHSTESL